MRKLTDAQLDRVYARLDNPTVFVHVDFRDLDALWFDDCFYFSLTNLRQLVEVLTLCEQELSQAQPS